MQRRFKSDPKWITVLHRREAPSRIVKPKSPRANAASTTPAISRFMALAADIAKRRSVILPHIGSTKTATKHEQKKRTELLSCQSTKQLWSAI
jgi:hypothetical protein